MANYLFVFTIVIVTASVSQSAQILKLLTNSKAFQPGVENDAKNDWGVDQDARGNQRQWILNKERTSQDVYRQKGKEGLQAVANVKEKLNTIKDLMQHGLPNKNKIKQESISVSLLQSQYYDTPKRKQQKSTDKSLQGNSLSNLLLYFYPTESVAKVFDAPRSEPEHRRIVKRFAKDPKDKRRKKEQKRKSTKRRKKRKKERMKKHLMRLKKQQANKLKRNEKLKLKAKNKQNMTSKVIKEKEADPNYDELYELSVEPKKKKRGSEEDYDHYNDPIPATDEMASDDWRHVKFSERVLNSSECEPEWFDNIDLSNMTDSEIDRRFPTQEDDEFSSDYSSSVSQKIKKNVRFQQNVKEDKEESVEYEGSGSYEDEGSGYEDDGSGSYEEEEGSGEYEDEEYEGSDDYDQANTNNRHNKNTNRKGKGMKAMNRNECKDGHCKHEEHKSKKQRKNKIFRKNQYNMKRINLLKERIGLADLNNKNKNNILKKSGSLVIDNAHSLNPVNLKTPHKIQLNKENNLKARKLNEEDKKSGHFVREELKANGHNIKENELQEKRFNHVHSEIKDKAEKSSQFEMKNNDHNKEYNENKKIDSKTSGKMERTVKLNEFGIKKDGNHKEYEPSGKIELKVIDDQENTKITPGDIKTKLNIHDSEKVDLQKSIKESKVKYKLKEKINNRKSIHKKTQRKNDLENINYMALKHNNYINIINDNQNILLNTQTVDNAMNSKTKNNEIKNMQNVRNVKFKEKVQKIKDEHYEHLNNMNANEQHLKDIKSLNKQLNYKNNEKENTKVEKMKMDFEHKDKRKEKPIIDFQIMDKVERLQKDSLETQAVFHNNHNLALKRPIARV